MENRHEPTPDIDALYEAMRPRLSSARRSYLRRRLAVLAAVPLLLGAGLAWAQPGGEPEVSQLAGAGEHADELERPEPEPSKQERFDDKATDRKPTDRRGSDRIESKRDEKPEEVEAVEFQPVSLGAVGMAYVASTDEGLVLGELDLEPGWSGEQLVLGDAAHLVLVLVNGDAKLTATIVADGDHLVAKLSDASPEPHQKDEPTPTPEPTPKPEVKDQPTEHDEPKGDEPKKDAEPEVERRKEIAVGEVGTVVVEREGKKLWLAVTWSHKWWDQVVVVQHGPEVHAYFTNDGFEKHVRAWIKGTKIKYETWLVEPEIQPYDGWVSCGFGDVGILVEGHIARVMTVPETEGVEVEVLVEVGEVVKLRFTTETEVWVMEAWGNGHEVVRECGQVE